MLMISDRNSVISIFLSFSKHQVPCKVRFNSIILTAGPLWSFHGSSISQFSNLQIVLRNETRAAQTVANYIKCYAALIVRATYKLYAHQNKQRRQDLRDLTEYHRPWPGTSHTRDVLCAGCHRRQSLDVATALPCSLMLHHCRHWHFTGSLGVRTPHAAGVAAIAAAS